MDIYYVAPENVGAVWHRIAEFVARVCKRSGDRRTPAGTLHHLASNYATLFIVEDQGDIIGFCAVKQVQYDGTKLLQVELLSGDRFDEWIDQMHDVIEHFAKENGCSGMELIGRKGWIRKLSRFGWGEAFVTCQIRWDKDEQGRRSAG